MKHIHHSITKINSKFQVSELRAELGILQKQADERSALHERELKRAKQASERTADMYRFMLDLDDNLIKIRRLFIDHTHWQPTSTICQA